MKNIVITGASKGIGFEVAKQLSTMGHHVYAIARSSEKLSNLQKQSKGQITPITCDLTDPDQVYQFSSHIDSESGIDILINNAGYLVNKPFSELSTTDWLQMIEANLLSVVHLTKALKPHLKKGSHIVNIGSMGGFSRKLKIPRAICLQRNERCLGYLIRVPGYRIYSRRNKRQLPLPWSCTNRNARKSFPRISSPFAAFANG